jgi:hypothetical protein
VSSEKEGSDAGAKKPTGRRKRVDRSDSSGRNVGEALRAVYRNAAAEPVPDEMLALLNKLG